jgi:tetratricopeptide (TPR) repeat protein
MTQQREPAEHFLADGIDAAKSGRKAQARALLQRAVKVETNNVTAWLWLSGVLDNPLEQEACLEKALTLDPDNNAARKGLAVVRGRVTQALFAQGISAAEDRDHETARTLLTQVVSREEDNLEAWLWLSRVVDTPEDQETCYENMLALDPDNAEAQNRLAALQQLREVADINPWADVHDEEPEAVSPAPTLAAAVLGEDYIHKHTTIIPEPEPTPESPAVALWAQYDDEMLCPYCAAPTTYEDRRCKTCGNALWLKVRRREERSVLLWILIALQALATGFSMLMPVVALYLISTRIGVYDFTKLINVYFGIAGDIPPEMARAALAYLPRGAFFLLWIPAVISAAFTVALYLRWPPIFYLMLVSAVLDLLASVIGAVLNTAKGLLPILAGGVGVIVSILSFMLVIRLEDDFKRDTVRVVLKVDEGIKNGFAYLLRGRLYAAQKMWARAALHYRRAAAMLPYQTDGHIAAATACIKLKNHELAAYILQEAQRINPEDAQVGELLAMIAADNGKQR